MVGEQHRETATTAFEILAHHRRRYALECLLEHETTLTLADLADEVAVREYDAPLPEIDPEDVTRVYLSLYHNHIPKLEAAEYVSYDQERDTVSLEDRAAQLEGFRTAFETEYAVAE